MNTKDVELLDRAARMKLIREKKLADIRYVGDTLGVRFVRDESFPIGYGTVDIDTTSEEPEDEPDEDDYQDKCAICHSDNCDC